MRPPRSRSRPLAAENSHRPAFVVVAAVLAFCAPTTLSAVAQTPIENAQHRAVILQHAVEATRLQAEVASEDYDRASTDLAQAVSDELSAQESVSAAGEIAAGSADRYEQRVRAMYMSGGQMSMVSSMLRANTLADALDRYANVSSIVSADLAAAASSDNAALRQKVAARRLTRFRERKFALQRRADQASARVETTLATQQQLLDNADEQVRVIAEQNAAAEASAQALAFAAALERATQEASRQLAVQRAAGLLIEPNVPAPTEQAAVAIEAAKTQLGKPYRWGATGPDSFDCSGLTGWAYRQAGVSLPRVSQDQWNAGPHPDLAHLLPGDLVFWASDSGNPSTIHHVGIFLGNNVMIAAPYTGTVVRIEAMRANGYLGATRPTQSAPGPVLP